MKNKIKILNKWGFIVIISIFIIIPTGCEEEEGETWNAMALEEYLKTLPPISDAMPSEKSAALVETHVDSTLEYIYHTEYYEAAAGFNEQIVLNPQTDVIYPGALVKGESILNGTYTLIPAERKPIKISTSLTGADMVSVEVDDPKLSTIREAVNTLMKQEYDVPYANMSFGIEQAYSEEQLDISLHASYKGEVINVEGGFDFTNKNIQTRLIVKYIQNYYTLDMDLPNKPSDLFEEDVNRALFGTYMPMYVSTVTFGRMALSTSASRAFLAYIKTVKELILVIHI